MVGGNQPQSREILPTLLPLRPSFGVKKVILDGKRRRIRLHRSTDNLPAMLPMFKKTHSRQFR